MSKSILDYNVAFEELAAKSGAEPTLREMIYKYYYTHKDLLTEEKAKAYARRYCEQIEMREARLAEEAEHRKLAAEVAASAFPSKGGGPLGQFAKLTEALGPERSGKSNLSQWTVRTMRGGNK